MRYSIDIIMDASKQAHKEALETLATHHTINDLMVYVKDMGNELELFLKRSIYKERRNKDTFFNLINDLSSFGVSSEDIQTLHKVRIMYNDAKHEPTSNRTSMEIINVLEKLCSTLSDMKKINLGKTYETQTYNRVVWIAGWDHYTSGDTEISIMIPYIGERFPPALDYFNIRWDGWDELVGKFTTQGSLKIGQRNIPESVYSKLSAEGEFIDAGEFSGDYRELILEISKYVDPKIEEGLLPHLQRKNDPVSMYYATIYAACDVVNKGRFKKDISLLIEEIYSILTYTYAAPRHSEYVKRIVPEIAEFFSLLHEEHQINLKGPFFLSKDKFKLNLQHSYLVSERFDISINVEGELNAILI